MSAKDPPIATRTLVGVLDKWRMRRDFVHAEAARYARVTRDPDPWMAMRWAAGLWEVRYGGR